MVHTTRYIQWQKSNFSSEEARAADAINHWQSRYELGTAVLLSEKPEASVKAVQKHWRKLTRQLQQVRQNKSNAQDILNTTRTIGRMQRIKFTSKDPLEDSGANFYVLRPGSLNSIPANCFTLYSFTTLPTEPVIALLAAEALVVAYKQQLPPKNLHSKSVLEEHLLSVEADVVSWLETLNISLEELNMDLEKANEALDTLLSSSKLQADFLSKTKLFLHTLQLASPLKLSTSQQERLKALEQLEKHVRVLSPAFLSDHIIDSSSDDSFLLRDLSKKSVLTLEALKEFIAFQYMQGHTHLAAALEHKAGFVRI